MSDAAKSAYERFRFKKRVCFKKCPLYHGKGGFCHAKKDNIDYCLSIEKQESDNRNYRNLQTVVEWIEVFAEEKGFVAFKPSEVLIKKAKHLLETTKQDCYKIAENLIREL